MVFDLCKINVSHVCSFIIYTVLYMAAKNAVISKIYYNLSGYGSMNETTKDAKAIVKSIKVSDVQEWSDNHIKARAR